MELVPWWNAETCFYWHFIFYNVFFNLLPWHFYILPLNFDKQSFINPWFFHWGYESGVYSIGAIMRFTLGLYSIGVINHAFSIGAIFKHSLNSYVLFSLSHMRYLVATTERLFLENSVYQTHWIKIRTHYSDREDQHHHLGDVKLLHW